MTKKLVIQIPGFNEEDTIAGTLKGLPQEIPGVDEILVLVIDDGSEDNTGQVALANGADVVIRHNRNQGLARAFLTGIKTSLMLGADIIVNTDADNQYPGRYIPALAAPIVEGTADIAIGNRQPSKNPHFSWLKQRFQILGSWFVRKLSKTNTPDAPSGFRAYSRQAALKIQVFNDYSYTLETLIQAGQDKQKIIHVLIETNPDTRPSRLHRGIFNFIFRQLEVILRSYILYRPLRSFVVLGIPLLLSGGFLLTRFLYFYLIGDSGIGRYVQSVSIGGTLLTFGFLLVAIGLLGDAISANRQMLQELIEFIRNQPSGENENNK